MKNQTANPTTATTLEKIQDKIAIIANMYSNGDPAIADEIISRTNLHIWTSGKANETEAFILQAARWQATDLLDGERSYSKYVGSIESEYETASADEEEIDWTEYLADGSMNPEDAVIAAEYAAEMAEAFESLSIDQEMIVNLLDRDFSPAQIAAKFGVSRAAISQKMSAIRNSLTTNPSMSFAL